MMSSSPHNHDSGLPVLPDTLIYVLVTVDGPGQVTIVSTPSQLGHVPHCFLSPFDTLIESAYHRNGGSLDTLLSVQVNWSLFEDENRRGLLGMVHLGWAARRGRILLRDSGELVSFAQGAYKTVPVGQPPGFFEIDAKTLAQVERIYEDAGLFAWRETAVNQLLWDDNKLYRALECALRTMDVESINGDPSWDQLALFDPECEQWHFVSFVKTT